MGFFAVEEFSCRCGCEMPERVLRNVAELTKNLEFVRRHLKREIYITSGYRCEKHNEKVGGTENSQHLHGKAADIRSGGMSGLELKAWFEAFISLDKIEDGGLGIYNDRPTILHYDIGPVRRWYE